MEREIKFRVWLKERSAMIVLGGHLGFLEFEAREAADEFRLIFGCNLSDDFIDGSINKENFVLMQFIGLVDKHGKEIYEGDILRVKYGKEYLTGQVVYGNHNGAFCLRQPGFRVPLLTYMSTLSLAATYDFEVIGNVYEHPELQNE